MSNLISIFYFVGFLPFLFIFWKRLREDYSSSQIFESGLIIILSMTISMLLFHFGLSRIIPTSTIFLPEGLWFWGGVVGSLIGLIVSILRLNLRFFETFESAFVGLLIWISIVFLTNSIKDSSLFSLVAGIVCLILVFLFFFLSGRYRKFTWYRSGKIGFTGLAVSGIFFFTRAITALIFPSMMSFVGRIDALLSALVSFILFLLLYNLAEK